ncbi:hypothetical protein CDL12_05097 [Handroanthus impetiginosus]|uniref:Uncharacterized protein n=1 Tax=Handroanthus impetiginosus TaxID=429701 RepID=A0A2G9HXF7_9LAMI|nr:hypothetical protein CDL12_05097 [Handroanthus impetiginosus]
MGGTAKMNAMRSAVVVAVSLAFGYLTLQIGFKPFLERAQLEQQRLEALQSASSQAQDSFDDKFPADGVDGLPESDNKL